MGGAGAGAHPTCSWESRAQSGRSQSSREERISSLTLEVVSPGQGGGTWVGQGGEGLSGAAHAVPALQINTGL